MKYFPIPTYHVNTGDIPEEGKVNKDNDEGGDAGGGGPDTGGADAGGAGVDGAAVVDVGAADDGGTGGVGAGRDEVSEILIGHKEPKKMAHKNCLIGSGVVLVVLAIAGLVGLTLYLSLDSKNDVNPCPHTHDEYKHGAIATDAHTNCSEIGVSILKKGSAVDAAIATILCVGLINLQSCGIGGGHVMTIYIKDKNKFFSVTGREMAPGLATEDMFHKGASSLAGGLSIAVPGEIKGLWDAHQKFGRLKWKDLFQPVIKLCREGYPMSPDTEASLKAVSKKLDDYKELRDLLWNSVTNTWKKAGDIIRNPKLANTLEMIAEKGAKAFYEGDLADNIVADIKDNGGFITAEDLKNYTARIEPAINFTMFNGLTLHTTTLPSSGPVLLYMLNILDGYKYGDSKVPDSERALAYHRLIEAFKFGYAERSKMGDDYFVANMSELISNMTDTTYGDFTRSQIYDNMTFNYTHYHPGFRSTQDSGTSHLSVLAPNGDAVAITSTINTYFGSKVLGSRTGIIFNNEMDDFSTTRKPNEFGIPPSKTNRIVPYKMPMSSMSPAIVVNKKGDVTHVLGASGGSRITTATTFAMIQTLWFKKTMADSIAFPRLHHQLLPQYIEMEKNFPADIQAKLEAKGHKVKIIKVAKSRVQGIEVKYKIAAAADRRKCGSVDGW